MYLENWPWYIKYEEGSNSTSKGQQKLPLQVPTLWQFRVGDVDRVLQCPQPRPQNFAVMSKYSTSADCLLPTELSAPTDTKRCLNRWTWGLHGALAVLAGWRHLRRHDLARTSGRHRQVGPLRGCPEGWGWPSGHPPCWPRPPSNRRFPSSRTMFSQLTCFKTTATTLQSSNSSSLRSSSSSLCYCRAPSAAYSSSTMALTDFLRKRKAWLLSLVAWDLSRLIEPENGGCANMVQKAALGLWSWTRKRRSSRGSKKSQENYDEYYVVTPLLLWIYSWNVVVFPDFCLSSLSLSQETFPPPPLFFESSRTFKVVLRSA